MEEEQLQIEEPISFVIQRDQWVKSPNKEYLRFRTNSSPKGGDHKEVEDKKNE